MKLKDLEPVMNCKVTVSALPTLKGNEVILCMSEDKYQEMIRKMKKAAGNFGRG